MAYRVTAVVFDPEQKRVESDYAGEIFQFEVSTWYLAFDRLLAEWTARHPLLVRTYGVEDLEIRTMAMIKKDD